MENAEKALPGITIDLGGEKKTLVLKFKAFCLLQKHTGKNPFKKEYWDNLGPIEIVELVWACLGGDSSGMTIDEITDKMSLDSIKDAMKTIGTLSQQATVPDELIQKKTEALPTEAVA